MQLNFSLEEFNLIEEFINNENNYKVIMDGVLLPNNDGAPDVPSLSNYIAVPQGANVKVSIKSLRSEELMDIKIAPAPRIPLDTDIGPLSYEKDQNIYSKDTFYPEEIVQLSESMKIRGVDVVLIAVNPFQYNPLKIVFPFSPTLI